MVRSLAMVSSSSMTARSRGSVSVRLRMSDTASTFTNARARNGSSEYS